MPWNNTFRNGNLLRSKEIVSATGLTKSFKLHRLGGRAKLCIIQNVLAWKAIEIVL